MSIWNQTHIAAHTARLMMPFTLALALVAACSGDDDVASTNDPETQAQIQAGEDRGDVMIAQLTDDLSGATDADAIGTTASVGETLNDGIVAQAQIALDRTSDPDVRDFAETLLSDHAANTDAIQSLLADRGISAIDNSISDDIKTDADDAAQTLQDTSADVFDSVFLNQQVMVHAQARVIIDGFNDMISDDGVASFWQDTSNMIVDHLNQAIDLADSI